MSERRGLAGARRLSSITSSPADIDDDSAGTSSAVTAAGKTSAASHRQRRCLWLPIGLIEAIRALGWQNRDALLVGMDLGGGDLRAGQIPPCPRRRLGERSSSWTVRMTPEAWQRLERLAAARDKSVSDTASTLLAAVPDIRREAGLDRD